jgi:subtilase family serine protease
MNMSRLTCLAILVSALLLCVLPQAASAEPGAGAALGAELGASSLPSPASAGPEEISLTPSTTKPYYACPYQGCQAINEPSAIKTATGYELPDGTQLVGGGPEGGYTPEELELAYNIPKTGGQEPEQQTVAVIDTHGDTTAESDLAVYRENYKLGECKKENAKKEVTNCFRKVNQKGEEANYPANEAGWGSETSLDLDMVSAACPECHILLVEANNEEESEMGAAVNKAVELGATEVSLSYGFPETYATRCPETGCSKYQSDYNHPGIPITVSAGDWGYDDHYYSPTLTKPAPLFPASSPTVISVGGTELNIVKNSRSSETVWSESGSGCSEFESGKTTGQKETEEKEGRKGCTGDRTDNDVAADASCKTLVSFCPGCSASNGSGLAGGGDGP